MRSRIICFLALAFVTAYTSATISKSNQERFLAATNSFSFTTFTLIKLSTTTTSTFTTTSTCTTSTAALTTCTVGRRRRGFFYDEARPEDRYRRGLFYNDEETHEKETVFLPTDRKNTDPVIEVPSKALSEDVVVPLEIQSGFALPEGVDSGRFLLSFGTSTYTSISITTTYVSLTAICSSISGFPTCGGVGK